MKSIIKKNCRLCNSNRIIKLFNLCDSPLANNLALTKKESLNLKYFPLNLMFCINCKHIQLQNVIKAEFLYSKYTFILLQQRLTLVNSYYNLRKAHRNALLIMI